MTPAILGIGWVTPSNLGSGKNANAFTLHQGSFSSVLTRIRLNPAYPRFARMDDYSKAALFGVVLAMGEAGLERWERKRPIGLIASTCSGCLETDIDYYQGVFARNKACASPHLFVYTLPSTFIGDASIYLGLTGPGFVIQETHPLSLAGLVIAVETLFQGEAQHMVVGACDAGIPLSFGSKGDANPYAVFMVIGNPSSGTTGYGKIEISKGSKVRFRGEPVNDFLDILHACGPCFPDGTATCPIRSLPIPEESAK